LGTKFLYPAGAVLISTPHFSGELHTVWYNRSKTERKMETRLAKALARAGISSRRKAEELIKQGLVTVNGRVITEPGTVINPDFDVVSVGGKPIRQERSIGMAQRDMTSSTDKNMARLSCGWPGGTGSQPGRP
jgi:ribosomal protein S4